MSETITLEFIGTTLRAIQAEQRTLRTENELLRTTLMNTMGEVVRVLSDRIGNFEALMEARFDLLAGRFDLLEARFDRLEALVEPRLAGLATRVDALEAAAQSP